MSLVPYQPELVDEIASRLDLRTPNRAALDALARRLGDADEPGVELVCDLATATGKSYIAAGIVDYLAASGHRQVLIVCHRTAILSKTRRNFTPGDSKYVRGLESRPRVVTVDNFRRGSVGQAMSGGAETLLYLFNVQQLLQPRGEMRRRTRDFDENLGASLYDHLAGLEDLVVIADEHHVYFGPQFSRSIRELHPLALIGLTATPHPDTPPASITFRYSLAEAIADGYVKVPVLVGRRDASGDLSRILADGVRLLERKQQAVDTWAAANGEAPVRAVMFLVCETIDEANDLAALLSRPEYLGSADTVLTVTSESPEEALVALDGIEDESSTVRAVVSVQMLQEGWDVKNIYVVATTRALESRALSEQILGRGLRLPFGRRTGHQMLDTVEVLSHRRFRELLAEAGVMLEAFFNERRAEVLPDERGDADATGQLPYDHGRVDAVVAGDADLTDVAAEGHGEFSLGLEIIDAGTRLEEVERQALQLTQEMHLRPGAPRFRFPMLRPTLRPVTFTLSDIESSEAEELGRRFTTEIAATLQRELLDMERVDDATGQGVRVAARAADEVVEATQLDLSLDDLRERLRGRILDSRYVERSRRESNAVNRLITAFLSGAGITGGASATWGEARVQAAVESFLAMVKVRHQRRPSSTVEEVEVVEYPRVGAPYPSEVFNRHTAFVAHRWFDGWNRNVLPVARFDAKSTEFAIANILDTDDGIAWWCRVESHQEVRIPYDGGTYFPDFIAVDTAGTHWVIEGKADTAAADPDVVAKRRAAERWVRHVNDSGDAPDEWHYLFVAEAAVRGAAGSWAALVTLGSAT